jgi:hypothetical protein
MQLEIQIYEDSDKLDAGWELVGTVRSEDGQECTLLAGATGRLGGLVSELNLYGVKDWVTAAPLSYEAGNRYIASLASFYLRNRRGAIIVLDGKPLSIMEVIDLVYPDWENRRQKERENQNVQGQGSADGGTGATGSASEGTVQEG